MRKIIFLLLFPMVINAQSNYDNWITPIADIEFSKEKVVYYYVAEVQPFFDRIVPLYYSCDLLLMYPVFVKVKMEQKTIDELKASVHNYLSNWSVQYSNSRDENRFLKYCCLQIIWDRSTLPENAIQALNILKNDLSILTSEKATLAAELYDSFNRQ